VAANTGKSCVAPVKALLASALAAGDLRVNPAAGYIKPAAVRAGRGTREITPDGNSADAWVSWHTFRHTNATLLLNARWNANQVLVGLGHTSPGFTLATYVHLLADDLPDLPTE
jgi:integrase